jgi:hypothetical protein
VNGPFADAGRGEAPFSTARPEPLKPLIVPVIEYSGAEPPPPQDAKITLATRSAACLRRVITIEVLGII